MINLNNNTLACSECIDHLLLNNVFIWFCKNVSAKTKGETSAEQAGARMLSH